MARLPNNQAWRWTVIGVTAAVVVVVVGALTGHIYRDGPDDVDCSKEKCVALTFDDGPGPYTDRLLQILKDNDRDHWFTAEEALEYGFIDNVVTQSSEVTDN